MIMIQKGHTLKQVLKTDIQKPHLKACVDVWRCHRQAGKTWIPKRLRVEHTEANAGSSLSQGTEANTHRCTLLPLVYGDAVQWGWGAFRPPVFPHNINRLLWQKK